MTYETFISILQKAGIKGNPCPPFSLDNLFIYKEKKKGHQNPLFIIKYWPLYGKNGGNYHGDEPKEFTGESEPLVWDQLNEILKEIAPKITYLEYCSLGSIAKEGSETEYEYYGNYCVYKYKIILLKDLYAKLVEIKAIKP